MLVVEVILGRFALDHGAGTHQWHIRMIDLFDLLKASTIH